MIVESLKTISDDELLTAVKSNLNVVGNQFDNQLPNYINDIKNYLLSAGVLKDVVNSTLAINTISRGVGDTWNYGNGDTKLSPYFYERADQLRSVEVVASE